MPFEIEIKTTKDTEQFLDEFPRLVRAGLEKGMKDAMLFAEAEAKRSFGKSAHLKVVTGRLRNSIRSRVRNRGVQLVGSIFSDVIYARIHEEGATIKARTSQYLRFQINNRWVRVPEVTIPARPFLEPAIDENLRQIEDILTRSVQQRVDQA